METINTILDDLAFLIRGAAFSFVSDMTIENGLGDVQHYNVHNDSIDNNTKTVTTTINSNIPGVGIYPPIIGFAEEIGRENFIEILRKYVEKAIGTYKELKNVQFDYTLSVDIQKFYIELKTEFYIGLDEHTVPALSPQSGISIVP